MKRRYSPQFKFQLVLEVLGGKSPAQVAKAYDVHPNSVQNWKSDFLGQGAEVFGRHGQVAGLERQIADLERLLGQKEMEIALLKNFMGRTP